MSSVELQGIEHRDYQIETAAELVDNPTEDYMVNMPVGGGKTETALEMIASQYDKTDDYAAMIVLPGPQVEDQWYERMVETYGMDGQLDIGRNKPVSQLKAERDSGKMIGTNFRGSDQGGSGLHQKRKRVEQWEKNKRNSHKEDIFLDNDVVLTTYQLLNSDFRNNRIDEEILLNYNDVVIDEATHFAAIDEVPGPDMGKRYRTNRYFNTLNQYLGENEDLRAVGLTAMFGEKMNAVQEQLGAELIRPSQERVDEYRPELERLEPNLAPDSDVVNLLWELEEQYRKTRHSIGRELDEENPNVNLYRLQELVDRGGEIARNAQKALKLKSLQSRLQEGTFNSLKPYQDDIIDVMEGHRWYETQVREEFEEGVPAGDILERDREKLEDPDSNDLPLFPTMKELGARRLQERVVDRDEQALYFVRHVDTANDMPNILPGDTAVITGQTDRDDQRDIIEDFDAGDIDALAMTYGSGGEGLDFSNTENVVLMGEPRTVQEHQNAVGRIRRGEEPKREHTMIYHNPDYEWRLERYEQLLEEQDEKQTNAPDPSQEALQAVNQALEPQAG
jgi:superfamily II DNA or RNA helicase